MHIRSKDTVVVITGKDKGKEGKVLVASPKTGKVVVEGVAIATKHQKPSVFGDDYNTPDGTGVRDYIHVVDSAKGHVAACDYAAKHEGCEIINLGTGVGYSVLENGTKVRVCKKCGASIED